jgi:Fe-S oxidoreductase
LDDGVKAILREHARAIAEDYPRHWRQSGGYRLDRLDPFNLAKLVCGSEGTLAVVTAATVRLVELPKAKMFAVGHFEDVAGAIAATADALGLQPSAVELIDRTILSLSRAKLEFRRLSDRLEGDPGALLFVSFSGDTDAEVRDKLDRLTRAWESHGHGYHTLRAETAAEQDALTKVRKAGLGLLMAASEGRRRPAAFVEDTAVAPDVLGDYVEQFKRILDRHGLKAGWYGHCSVGCLHIRPFVDLSNPAEVETMRTVAEEIVELVGEFGGVNSSEHGDGRVRSPFNERIFGPELYGAMRKIKTLFDPAGILNPGVMVDAAPLTAHIRDASLPAPRPLKTHLDFGEGGMYAAADRCQRIGACRKTGIGVMCPSYMATREEEHATRGRANALVRALSEPDPHRALGDERLHEILDLCLECKACKSECPLSVDMASLKAEALAHHHELHGTPLRSRLFGAIRTLNRLGSATAPLSNLPAPVRLLGITTRRPRPRFERETLIRWHRRRPRRTGTPVIFLADSFTTFTESSVPRAAIELLEAAGYDVHLESGGCCGRSSISKGLLDDARAKAEDLSRRLERSDAIITGCEPSCLLTLREEHVQLLGDRGIAGRTKLVEELLLEAVDAGTLRLPESGPRRRILFHGHCHQKALAGTAATVGLLRKLPNAEVVELDAGCCGMAGSFGFEAEHYELSMRIGGMRLFGAVRREPSETLIAATGVSCRQQIHHGTGRVARHPVQIVRDALGVPNG